MERNSVKDEGALLEIVVAGNNHVGKTLLVNRLCGHKESSANLVRTTCYKLMTKSLQRGSDLSTSDDMHFWDTPGNHIYADEDAPCYKAMDCCVLVFDITNSASFKDLENLKKSILKLRNPSNPTNLPFIVIGNKIDLTDRSLRQVDKSQAEKWCKDQNADYFEISTEVSTDQCCDNLLRAIHQKALGYYLDKNQDDYQPNPKYQVCSHKSATITYWVSDICDFSELKDEEIKTFEKSFKDLASKIGTADTNTAYDIIVQRKEHCYRRFFNTKQGDENMIIVTVDGVTPQFTDSVCDIVAGYTAVLWCW